MYTITLIKRVVGGGGEGYRVDISKARKSTQRIMQLIKCTKKLQKEMGLKKNDISENEPKESCLGSWHANLIYIDGKKCVLFANDKTLFNFIVPNIPRVQIKELSKVFLISKNLPPSATKPQFWVPYQLQQPANAQAMF